MKVKCSKCKHVISVSDEKLEGKEGKIKLRCPACKTPLAVRLPSKAAGPQEGEAVWYYSLDGNQEGPVTAAVMKSLIADGKVHGGTDVWRPGLDEWVKASTLEELWEGTARTNTMEAPVAAASDVFSEKTMEIDAANLEDLQRPDLDSSRAESPVYSDSDPSLDPAKAALERSKAMLEQAAAEPAPEPIHIPAAQPAPVPKKEEEDDLFGSFGAGSDSHEDEEAVDSANLAHTRRETSVLFSLDEMKGGKKGKKAKKAVEDDSGLIDIRQMSVEKRDDDIFASFGGGQTVAEEPSHLMGAGGQNSMATAALNVPILKRKKKWPFVVAAVAVGLIVVLGAGGFYVAFNAYFGPGSPKWLEDQLRAAHTNALNDATTLSKKASEELASQKDAKLKEVEDKIEALRNEHDKRYALLDSEADKARKEVQSKFDEEIGVLNKQKTELQEKLVAMAGEKKVVVVQQPVPADVKTPENPTPPNPTDNPPEDGGKKPNNTTNNPKTNNPKTNNPKTNNPTDGGGTQGGKTPTNPTNPTNNTTGNEVKNPTNNEAADILGKVDGGTGSDGGDGGTAKKALTTTDVTKAVAEARPGMKDCFSQYAGELEGATIRARLTIAPNGEVTGVVVASAEYAGTALGNCVRDKMNKMKFPAFSGSPVTKTISVRLP